MSFDALKKIGLPDDRVWSDRIFRKHYGVSHFLKARYIRQARSFGKYQANGDLRRMSEALIFATGHTASMEDQGISDLAGVRAVQAEHIYKTARRDSDVKTVGEKLIDFCDANGVAFPVKFSKKDSDMDRARKIISAAERVSDERWWRRQLRVLMGRQTEGVLRDAGFVRKGKSPYVSNWALVRWKQSQKRNRKTLARLEAATKDRYGDETTVDLVDCIDASVSNPENRRHELMTRMRGFEEVARGLGLMGQFYTLTCPSKFHAQHVGGGMNAKHDGSTPIDAMAHLNSTWAKIRAEWARNGIKTFGFRIAEPHHDGTPHFHFMLFFNVAEKDKAAQIFSDYALAVDGDEPGAEKYRSDVVDIDPAKGTAAGYIAKYVSKNIDGFAVDDDEEGECFGDEGAMRVRAWASLWGIRQFQQIGSVSVTVWRELRRDIERFEHLNVHELDQLGVVEKLRLAADAGNWAEFVELMGGAFVSRDDQTLRPFYHEGEIIKSRYGEGVRRLIGLWLSPVVSAMERIIFTREKVWEIRERGFKAAQPPPSDLCQ